MAQDDQRAKSFLATHDSSYANAFPLSPTGADRTLAFSATEFRVRIGRKLGIPLGLLGGFVDQAVRASGNSRRTRVDPFGNGVAAAPGVPGDHFRKLHDHIVNTFLYLLRDAGIPCRGGPLGSCKHISASVSMLLVLLQMRTSSAFSMESSQMVSLMLATAQAMIRSRHPTSSWDAKLSSNTRLWPVSE